MIKLRASTVGKMREVEVLREAGSGGGEAAGASEVMQGLYARSQTEKFVPDPVIDVSFTIVRFRFPSTTFIV
jgi:xeroderma pigmentosum group C-complementing protein